MIDFLTVKMLFKKGFDLIEKDAPDQEQNNKNGCKYY
jgi:hypothetical protein